MQKQVDTSSRWGRYVPDGLDKVLFLVRQAGLVHGPVKNLLTRAWLARHPDAPVDIEYQGVKYRLYPSDNVTDQKILFGSRRRDRAELGALRGVVGDGGIFIDIGANIGYYALMAACFGAARVLAIEPNPQALERLVFNIAANDCAPPADTSPRICSRHALRRLSLANLLEDTWGVVRARILNRIRGSAHGDDPGHG